MANILPRDLDPAASVNPNAAVIVDSGASVERATPGQIVDAGRPNATQSEAEAGLDNEKGMTPLRVKQAMAAQALLVPANGVAKTLALLKAAPVNNVTMIYDGATFNWTSGNFTGQADNVNVVKADSEAITSGAWIRQSAGALTTRQPEAGSVTRSLAARLLDIPVTPEDFGAVGDGVTNDGPAFQKALDTKRPIVLKQLGSYNIGTTALLVKTSGQVISGNNAELHYYGTASALGFELNAGSYRFNGVLKDFTVYIHTEGATGIRWRASYSEASNVAVVLYASNQVGWLLEGDTAYGTGVYYVNFYNCHVQGRAFLPDYHDQIGWLCLAKVAIPGRCPNACRWFGGRASGCNVNYQINGSGNHLYGPTSETVPAGGWHFRIDNPLETSVLNAGCSVIGAYLEGQAGSNGFFIGRYAKGTAIHGIYATGIGASLFDDAYNNLNGVNGDGVKFSGDTSADPRVLDAYYEYPPFTPGIAGSTVAGTNTYSKQKGTATRIGNRVFGEIAIVMTAKDAAMAGSVYVTGLPVPSASSNQSAISVSASNFTLSAGFTQFGGEIGGSVDRVLLTKIGASGDGAFSSSDVPAGAYITFSFSYRV